MSKGISRRAAIGAGTAAVAAVAGATGGAVPASARPGVSLLGPQRIAETYRAQKTKARGIWHSHIAAVDSAGALKTVVEDDADFVIHGYSVQKLFVAMAVLDKVDRGQLSLGQKLDMQASIILGGSGIYHLHGVWGDDLTIANFLTAMLLVSDNTSVRMCGRVVPALEINEILAAKGFTHTRVEPVANPNRFFLGVTTPRETHDLLWRLANKTLLSPASCDFMLRVTRWVNGYHDGVRRNMSSVERSRIATKYGAETDDLGGARHEAGIMFGSDGAPVLTYAMFAEGLGDTGNFGATHPAVEAHAKLGRVMFDTIGETTNPLARARQTVKPYRPESR
ncbi:serine hydrolase [Phytohabitans aurantiacus]|jgi:beta-lactamase class A|uniref:Beta-lactamase n=1 Tax=Phytohabitans aurantiacus TaxID=3016789 RepID=A0ABQ5QWF4_9ACTN|nr:serine hydrolase [Phytohabitans aurantiacus]GLH98769.1 serine hydrolase [Phytohabitans aurantiacus]